MSGKIGDLDLRRHLQLNAVKYTTYASRMAKNLDIKTSTLIPLRRANAVADASTAQKVRRRNPSRHKMDTKLEGSTLTRSGKGSTTTRFVCSPNSFTEAWGSYCSGRLVDVSDASPDSGFLSPNIHSCMRACMHAFIHWSVSPERRDTQKVPIFEFMLKRCFGSSFRYHFHDPFKSQDGESNNFWIAARCLPCAGELPQPSWAPQLAAPGNVVRDTNLRFLDSRAHAKLETSCHSQRDVTLQRPGVFLGATDPCPGVSCTSACVLLCNVGESDLHHTLLLHFSQHVRQQLVHRNAELRFLR